ncbi:MAG: hypothetical protein ACRD3F_04925 [Acidobacteriaceae bacterium]
MLRRELAEAAPAIPHRHRIPIGLVLLTQGWITHEQLRQALKAQQEGSDLRLGKWLVTHQGLDEMRLTQALGIQWNCPVFRFDSRVDDLAAMAVPRLLSETFGFVPLRLTRSGILYLAFEDRIDHSVVLAIERITKLRVESGLLSETDFLQARERVLQAHFPRTRLIEAGNHDLLADAFAKHIEGCKPVQSRLVRIRDLFWLRMWTRTESRAWSQLDEVEDVVGSVVRFSEEG